MTIVLLTNNTIYTDSRASTESIIYSEDWTKIYYNDKLNFRYALCGYTDFSLSIQKWSKKIPKYFMTSSGPYNNKRNDLGGNILGFKDDKICAVNIKMFANFNIFTIWKNDIKFYPNADMYEYWTAGSGQKHLQKFIKQKGHVSFIINIKDNIQEAFDYVALQDNSSNNIIQSCTI